MTTTTLSCPTCSSQLQPVRSYGKPVRYQPKGADIATTVYWCRECGVCFVERDLLSPAANADHRPFNERTDYERQTEMLERLDQLEQRVALLLQAFATIKAADQESGEVVWLADSCARAIRETQREIAKTLEDDD